MTQIDHKEAALSYLEGSVYSTFEMTNAEKATLAQVHATLAIAEQLRIANMIAAYSNPAIQDEIWDQVDEDDHDKGRWAGGTSGVFVSALQDAVRSLIDAPRA